MRHIRQLDELVCDIRYALRTLARARTFTAVVLLTLTIGVGSGARAVAWLVRFKTLDEQCGTNFYSRLHFILGDYSPTSLERAMAACSHHGAHVSPAPLDALNPEKTLTKYRFKLMYVHLTNVYDNLPTDELVRREAALALDRDARRLELAETELRVGVDFAANLDQLLFNLSGAV